MLVDAKKVPLNLSFPPEVDALFREMAKQVSGKQFWIVAAASYLAFRAMPENERNAAIREVAGIDAAGESFAELIEKVKTQGDKLHPVRKMQPPQPERIAAKPDKGK